MIKSIKKYILIFILFVGTEVMADNAWNVIRDLDDKLADMGKILKRINDEESARDCENSIQTTIRELDDISRRLLRLEIPIDQTEAKKMSAAIDRAVNAFEWNQQLSRLRANGFYGLGRE